jgi:hypothetical protein
MIPQVQAAIYGPLVLAVLPGGEGLRASMIYGVQSPNLEGHAHMLPCVAAPGVWVTRIKGGRPNSLRFETSGPGTTLTLIPLNQVMDQRYSVYVRNTAPA